MKMYNPAHPGEVLYALCIEPANLTITDAAKAMGMTRSALSEIINGRRSVTPKVAIKFAKAFGGSAESWINMQAQYDLWQAEQTYQGEDVTPLFNAEIAIA